MALSRNRARVLENLDYFGGSLVNGDFEKNVLSGENEFADCIPSLGRCREQQQAASTFETASHSTIQWSLC